MIKELKVNLIRSLATTLKKYRITVKYVSTTTRIQSQIQNIGNSTRQMNRFPLPISGRDLNLANQKQYVDHIWILTKTNHLKGHLGDKRKN